MKLAPCAALGSDNNEHYWLWSCELSLFYGSKAVVYCLVWLIMHFVKVDQMVGLMLDQVFYIILHKSLSVLMKNGLCLYWFR
jgi:hypothetical protein